MKRIVLLIVLAVFFLPKNCFAENSQNQFITIVNPVRISSYSTDPAASFEVQYQQIKKRDLPATWLITYDVLQSEVALKLKSVDPKQEVGIFMEVGPGLSEKAKVTFNKSDSWHRAKSVFLSGYTQEDRIKLIDTVFNEFKQKLGYYPSSVGGWWVDSYSLEYMAKKYGVNANLTVSDQFSTDGYQVWGQYWSVPFYPSKYHSGIPATTEENKLNVVMFQWAPRDPLNGYFSPTDKRASLYSTQDYFTVSLGDDYLEKLVNLYAKKGRNEFGQITLGLEGDFSPQAYTGGNFISYLDLAKKLSDTKEFEITNMKGFTTWYAKNFPGLSKSHIVETDDLLGKKIKVFWYQSPYYRVGLTYDYQSKQTKIFDLRAYTADLEEPYYISPNQDLDLTINVPSLINQADDSLDEWVVLSEELVDVKGQSNKTEMVFKNDKKIVFEERTISLKNLDVKIPQSIKDASFIDKKLTSNDTQLFFNQNWLYGREGVVKENLSPEALYLLNGNKVKILEVIFLVVFIVYIILVFRSSKSYLNKTVLAGFPLIAFIAIYLVWFEANSEKYFVNQGEIDALFKLSVMPEGAILVYDSDCLQCSWHSRYKPNFFVNDRDYVGKLASKKIVKNKDIIESSSQPKVKDLSNSREKLKEKLDSSGVKYIYLVKYEDYREVLPYSPGDLGVEKIYSNANAEIWKVR